MYNLPSARTMYRIGHRWTRINDLDLDITILAGYMHDWIHATFNLSTKHEAIVFACEEFIELELVPDLDLFFDIVMDNETLGDSFTVSDIERAFCSLIDLTR